jgi:UDP-sugar pyrophosphorylase
MSVLTPPVHPPPDPSLTLIGSHRRYEALGLLQAEGLGFVIPAGGLGERLGFSGVKFELPAESATGATVLQTYASYILAVQAVASERAGRPVQLPLAIMTSDDTHAGIGRLLDRLGCYGLDRGQVTLLKQEKVAALSDAEGSLAVAGDGYGVLTKPHGHGDVHFLMHSTGTASRWRAVRLGVRAAGDGGTLPQPLPISPWPHPRILL